MLFYISVLALCAINRVVFSCDSANAGYGSVRVRVSATQSRTQGTGLLYCECSVLVVVDLGVHGYMLVATWVQSLTRFSVLA